MLSLRSLWCDASAWGLGSRPRLWWCAHIVPPEGGANLGSWAVGGALPDGANGSVNGNFCHVRLISLSKRFLLVVLPSFLKFCRVLSFSDAQKAPPLMNEVDLHHHTAVDRSLLTVFAGGGEAGQQFPSYQFRRRFGNTGRRSRLCQCQNPRILTRFPADLRRGCPNVHAAVCWAIVGICPLPRAFLFIALVSCQAGEAQAERDAEWCPEVWRPTLEARWSLQGSRPIVRAASMQLASRQKWGPSELSRVGLEGLRDSPTKPVQWAQALSSWDVCPRRVSPASCGQLEFGSSVLETSGHC